MTFATVGSHPSFKFERLLRALESVPVDDLVVQHGPGRPPANAREAFRWMPYDLVQERISQAACVVSHAGVGTVLAAIAAGHVPIVLPRLRRYAETVDNHQLELARALADTGRVLLVENAEHLAEAVAEAPERGAARSPRDCELVAAVRNELLGTAADSR